LEVYKEADFLEPFVVLKKKKQMLKVGQYTPEILNDGRLTKRKKKITVMGWLPQERLLLWNNSLKNTYNGFAMKATLVVNASDVMVNTNKYIENDSVIIYKSPDFNEKALKMSIGEIVYIYKESEDKEMLLIGKYPSASTDKIKENIYGWVSKNMLSLWGDRTAIRLFPNENLITDIWINPSSDSKVAVKSTNINHRAVIENI
ncbi:type VI secretion system protein TssR domain-containing protein, partial [Capnocytophaga canis]|uniref:type VI secretion system protein TssR domain-containing protein n=1 Tax=Capnocytophaga canis TaxID=1848903 RepID=UPI0023EE30FA